MFLLSSNNIYGGSWTITQIFDNLDECVTWSVDTNQM